MKRKSPLKHKVNSYTRNGKKVTSYVRGKGTKSSKKSANPTPVKPKGYTVTLRYSKKAHDIEVVKVIATSYQRAVDEALEEKVDSRQPIEMEIVDPSIGEIIRWAGSRTLEAGERAVRAGGRYAKSKLRESYDDWEARKLVDQAYSPNKAVRMVARSKLKNKFPLVWDVMDISRS